MIRYLGIALLACVLLGQSTKPLSTWPPVVDPAIQMQHAAGNPARCPLDHQPVENIKPMALMVEGDNSTPAALSLPVLVCPRDGVIFAVQP